MVEEQNKMPEIAKQAGFEHLFLDNQPAYDQLIGLIYGVPDLLDVPEEKKKADAKPESL